VGLASLALILSQVTISSVSVSPLVLHFFDIGYGDAILVQLPEGGAILIDSGKPEDGAALVEQIRALGLQRLESVFITHFHKDHAGGLLPILDAFLAEPLRGDNSQHPIIVPLIPETGETEVESVLKEIKRRGYRLVRRRETLRLSPSVQMHVLHPKRLLGNPNDDSLVLRIEYGAHAFLFGGDVGLIAQQDLLAVYGEALKADLLKIPHHANEVFNDGFEAFIQTVAPKIAVLTLGPNRYGAPNPELLSLYEKRVYRLLRTDQDGTITVKSDGRTLQIETER